MLEVEWYIVQAVTTKIRAAIKIQKRCLYFEKKNSSELGEIRAKR